MKHFCQSLTVLIAMSFTGNASALVTHPNHVSLTEIEWNAKTGNFEFAICLWPEDLEKALSGQEQKPISFDSTPNLDQLLAGYVEQTVKLRVNDQPLTNLRWVGYETNNKQTWLYFELRHGNVSDGKKICQLQNSLLCELNAEQQNKIHFKNGTLIDVGVCSAISPELVWQFEQNAHMPGPAIPTKR